MAHRPLAEHAAPPRHRQERQTGRSIYQASAVVPTLAPSHTKCWLPQFRSAILDGRPRTEDERSPSFVIRPPSNPKQIYGSMYYVPYSTGRKTRAIGATTAF